LQIGARLNGSEAFVFVFFRLSWCKSRTVFLAVKTKEVSFLLFTNGWWWCKTLAPQPFQQIFSMMPNQFVMQLLLNKNTFASVNSIAPKYHGIVYMLLAALGFSIMGGAAKALKDGFNAGQLVFWRNIVGLIVLIISFIQRSPVNAGSRPGRLLFRGLMGTTALYTLLYCILHLPLGTAMSYNLTSALFIALFSFLLFREYAGGAVLLAVLIGFAGMLLIYKPNIDLPWYYHLAGLISGVSSAVAYLTVGKLTKYYDTRVIVLSFVLTGVVVPLLFVLLKYLFQLPADELFFIDWRWPAGKEWWLILLLGASALFGQFFVTKAYGADKAGIVSAISYANIPISIAIGMLLGDAFPDTVSLIGIICIIGSGIFISFLKKKSAA
jgi:drug/metabolite transporter (DMT)-like permease